jgi:YggT family protein
MLTIIQAIFGLLQLLVLARVIVSWIRPDPYNPIVRAIYQLTEPIMEPVRRLLPTAGGLDFSPIVVLLGLSLLERVVLSLLIQGS